MLGSMVWTAEEVERLRLMYPSEASFEEIVGAFPGRTRVAVRLKASRLGLGRPSMLLKMGQRSPVLFCSDGNGGARGYLYRCGRCGSWVQVSGEGELGGGVSVCGGCGATCYLGG